VITRLGRSGWVEEKAHTDIRPPNTKAVAGVTTSQSNIRMSEEKTPSRYRGFLANSRGVTRKIMTHSAAAWNEITANAAHSRRPALPPSSRENAKAQNPSATLTKTQPASRQGFGYSQE